MKPISVKRRALLATCTTACLALAAGGADATTRPTVAFSPAVFFGRDEAKPVTFAFRNQSGREVRYLTLGKSELWFAHVRITKEGKRVAQFEILLGPPTADHVKVLLPGEIAVHRVDLNDLTGGLKEGVYEVSAVLEQPANYDDLGGDHISGHSASMLVVVS